MIYSQDRDRLRGLWCDAWRKARAPESGESVEPLEQLMIQIVVVHPEYHAVLENPAAYIDHDWEGATNPFLHLGMHLALQESLTTDRPLGVRQIHHALVTRMDDVHTAEHRIMECLAEILWQAQRQGIPPDEQSYLNCLRHL